MTSDRKHICIIAGEPSGDVLGGRLIHALKAVNSNLEFSGIGGNHMMKEGLESLFPMSDLSVMGLIEVLPRIPKLLHRIKQTSRHIEQTNPDIVVTIDSPDFSFRVAKKLQNRTGKKPKMLHYVAPTVWAWRPERAVKVAALYDGLMCLFPFEPEYFKGLDMKTACTGHPMIEELAQKADAEIIRSKFNIDLEHTVLGLFFGSRMGEINRMGPILRDVAVRMAEEIKNLHILVPTLPHLEKQARNLLEDIPCKTHLFSDPDLKYPAYAAMDAALAVSGTIGLELAVAGVPHVIGYKMNALTWRYVKHNIRVEYAHLANIMLEHELVPEFIQERCRADRLKEALLSLLNDKSAASMQKEGFVKVREMLAGNGEETPSEQVAHFCLGL